MGLHFWPRKQAPPPPYPDKASSPPNLNQAPLSSLLSYRPDLGSCPWPAYVSFTKNPIGSV